MQIAHIFLVLVFCSSQLLAQVVDVNTFEKQMTAPDVQLLDARTGGEFKNGHLPKALQADWTRKDEFKDRVKHLDKQKPVYIYCLSGGRSGEAAKWMRENGFTNVVEMQGGVNAWKRANKSLEQASAVKGMSLEDFSKLLGASEIVLVDVGAAWCPPCKKMEPSIEKFLSQNKDVKLLKVDGGNDNAVMESINASVLPTLVLYKNGKEFWRKEGISTVEEMKAGLSMK
jgi:rhodanese-related sulfurtransferase